jgi:lipid-binding SYLF domain-containing protein
MKATLRPFLLVSAMMLAASAALADSYSDAVDAFKQAGQSASFFSGSYAYAVLPTIGKGGLWVGAAFGRGRVYRQGHYIADTSMTQVSAGLQAGGQAYSEIIFFKDERALRQFMSGHFELGADVGAVAITASVEASATTGVGATATASGSQEDAATVGGYHHGIAVFTLAKGGAMYEAAVAGQKFTYRSIKVAER